ncbi:MAG: hypothetical protein ACR2H3_03215 [Acidimicrobiales bacterium]
MPNPRSCKLTFIIDVSDAEQAPDSDALSRVVDVIEAAIGDAFVSEGFRAMVAHTLVQMEDPTPDK